MEKITIMKCLFCGNKLVDTSLPTYSSISKDCEFTFLWHKAFLAYYICINRRIAIFDWGWSLHVKNRFFREGTFISYNSYKHKEFEFDYKVFLKGGFVF